MTPAIEALQTLLRDPQVGWSLGRPGAIAEFCWDNREPVIRSALSIATSRGALRIACGDSLAVSCVTSMANPPRWRAGAQRTIEIADTR